jgi:hypothetical protein
MEMRYLAVVLCITMTTVCAHARGRPHVTGGHGI